MSTKHITYTSPLGRLGGAKRGGASYFHHPFLLENEPRIKQLRQKMWLEGIGIFWTIFRQLRLCNGRYPLNAIIAEADGKPARERKIMRVLTDFDLFIIENGIVQLQSGLSAAELSPDRCVAPKDKAAVLRKRLDDGYEDQLFPEDMEQMDRESLNSVKEEIKSNNLSQIEQFKK